MKVTMQRILPALGLFALCMSGGCKPPPPQPDMVISDDLSVALDMTAPPDLTNPPPDDLTNPPPDLTAPPDDLTTPPQPDMTMQPADMTMQPADMTMPPQPDLTTPRDMTMPPQPDLTTPRDMTMPPQPDLTMPRDMATPPGDMAMTCAGTSDCSMGTQCCANFSLGAGTLPNCPVLSQSIGCRAGCNGDIKLTCPAMNQVRLCKARTDCAGDPGGYVNCCSFNIMGTPRNACITNLIKALLNPPCLP